MAGSRRSVSIQSIASGYHRRVALWRPVSESRRVLSSVCPFFVARRRGSLPRTLLCIVAWPPFSKLAGLSPSRVSLMSLVAEAHCSARRCAASRGPFANLCPAFSCGGSLQFHDARLFIVFFAGLFLRVTWRSLVAESMRRVSFRASSSCLIAEFLPAFSFRVPSQSSTAVVIAASTSFLSAVA